jgi:predicted nuclease of predicted toxin-antitoxin system
MRFLVDENIPRITVDALIQQGHDVKDIRGTPEHGADDTTLWTIALSESRVLVTTDKGFTDHRNEAHHGILIVRLRQPNRQKIHAAAMRTLETLRAEDWKNLLVVVRDTVMSTSRRPNEPPA